MALEFEIDVEGNAKKKKKDSAKEVSKGMQSVLQGLGIGSGIGIIVNILKSFQPLLSMVSLLIKEIAFMLSPITDVILTLLYPVLLLLKPIVFAVNQVMLPFLKQAMTFMREGIKEGDPSKIVAGTSTILSGLNAVMLFISGDLIKMTSNLLLTIVAGVVGLFSSTAANFITNEIIPGLNNMIDSMTSLGMTSMAMNVVALGKAVGTNTESFRENFIGSLDKLFPNLSDDFVKGLTETLDIVQMEGYFKGFLKLGDTASDLWTNFGSESSSFIDSAFKSIIASIGGAEIPIFSEAQKDSLSDKIKAFAISKFKEMKQQWEALETGYYLEEVTEEINRA